MFASKIFQSVPKNAILIRLQDKKKSLAKISGLWHNESRTIFDSQEIPPHTIRKVMKMKDSHTAAPYLFQISSYDISRLLPQVSKALEKRSEHLSRERYPKMWRSIDRLPSPSRGAKRSRLRTRLFSVLCLAAGVILVVPGLMEPKELLVPLVAGAAAVVLGASGLWRTRKNREKPFDRSARLLLEGKDQTPESPAPVVSFSDQGMTFSEKDKTEFVPYSDFESAWETEDTLLLVFGQRVTLLQKRDLVQGDFSGLSRLLAEKVAAYQRMD